MVASRQCSYLNAHKAEKKVISKSIVDQIRQRGGRFLKYNDQGDMEDIGDIKANEKTCQALREGLKIRIHSKEQHERNDQISSTFYPPQNHNFYYQSFDVQNSYGGANPPNFTTHSHSQPVPGPNYNRVAYQQQHFNYGCQQQRQMHNYYYKDCHNTPGHMQEANKARSKAYEKNTAPFRRHVASAFDHNAHAANNHHLLGNRHGPSQTNASFSYGNGYGYYHGFSAKGTVPVAKNSYHSSPSSVSPCFQNDKPMVDRTD